MSSIHGMDKASGSQLAARSFLNHIHQQQKTNIKWHFH